MPLELISQQNVKDSIRCDRKRTQKAIGRRPRYANAGFLEP
ncbi:hypothetical protein [Moorena sp. SIO3H5]|nr:hypothetical protein [Moorena sp. SIO3H5]